MKLFLLLASLGLLPGLALAQQVPPAQVPAAVQAAFWQAQLRAARVAWHRCPADQLPGERTL